MALAGMPGGYQVNNHVAALLDQAVYHIELLRLGIADAPAAALSQEHA